MKLYTEKQVIEAISKAFRYNSNVSILKSLTPIELPSDEEIDDKIEESIYSLKYDTGFKFGAKWAINHIKK